MTPGYRFRLTCPEGHPLEHHSDETRTATVRRTFTYCDTCGEFYALTVFRAPKALAPTLFGDAA